MLNTKNIIIYFLLGILTSLFFALLEIQIEGKHGWAEKLPTWKKQIRLFNLKIPPLTGYHLYIWLFFLVLCHTPFILSPWTLQNELLILSFYTFVLILEDFLWFVFNPEFGIRKFKKEYIPWHMTWFGPFPTQYYSSITLWVLLFYFADRGV